MFRLFPIIINVLFGFCCSFAAMPQVAVVGLTGDSSLTDEQVSFISGKLSTELVSTKQFIVLDRSRIDEMLKEQSFQQTGLCNSSAAIGACSGIYFNQQGLYYRSDYYAAEKSQNGPLLLALGSEMDDMKIKRNVSHGMPKRQQLNWRGK